MKRRETRARMFSWDGWQRGVARCTLAVVQCRLAPPWQVDWIRSRLYLILLPRRSSLPVLASIAISLRLPSSLRAHPIPPHAALPLVLPLYIYARPTPHHHPPLLPSTPPPMSASSSSRVFAQHVRVSSTDELSYDASTRGEINETIHTIVTGRKCWKTMKGKGEVVWPPFLELALVEGLEKYQPVESRTTRAFGRFPMRNKFISDYIFNKTGKRRTPKQVGSRLQQLRDTAEGKRILQQLSSRHIAMMQPKVEPTPDPSTSADGAAPAGPPVNYLTIDILPDTPGSGYPSPALSPLAGPSTSGPQPPRPMRAIDPTVTFISRTALHAYASVRVMRDGQAVWAEKTTLTYRDSSVVPAPVYPAQMECNLLYSTEVVPGFWGQLCESGDPTPFTIVQDIVRLPSGADAASAIAQTGTPPPEDVLLSIVYRFIMHSSSSPPLSPSASSVDALSYSHESSVSQLPPYMQEVVLTDVF
ncbi:hypothetical protein DAEQUDRAFT_528054 [Daedalea quercina L-15889]|uniref:TEA domain-containing protein n=1 Tax=Daedalea quercina L-15889 TaxID=1314783 RepID=A0A165MA11_9APHY|nr:hypothetical protein DAEQUDRAFT_528054 [Daedalea quercina L-15889]